MATISYDDVPALAGFAHQRDIGMTLLSDKGSAIIKAFDVLNESFAEGSPDHGIAYPIIFISNADGVITHRFSGLNYTIRPDIDTVSKAIGG